MVTGRVPSHVCLGRNGCVTTPKALHILHEDCGDEQGRVKVWRNTWRRRLHSAQRCTEFVWVCSVRAAMPSRPHRFIFSRKISSRRQREALLLPSHDPHQPRLCGPANLATRNAAFRCSWVKNADWSAWPVNLLCLVVR